MAADSTPTTGLVSSFVGSHFFLSNFYPWPLPSLEHLYQAAKTTDVEWRQRILSQATPGKAKRLGATCPLRMNWETIKLGVMAELVHRKFQQALLRDFLLGTGTAELVEGNTWGDSYWGALFTGDRETPLVGDNHLGKILMMERARIQALVSLGGYL